MGLKVTLVQGGGAGLDQAPAVQRIVAAAGVAIDWDEHLAGWASMERGGPPLPDALLKSVRATGLALKIGMRVRHAQFGIGTVLSVEALDDDVKLVVRFTAVGQKTLRAKYAKLEPA